MVIRHVTPDIVTMSLPFARFGHLQFGGRGTLGECRPLQSPPIAYDLGGQGMMCSPVKPTGPLVYDLALTLLACDS